MVSPLAVFTYLATDLTLDGDEEHGLFRRG